MKIEEKKVSPLQPEVEFYKKQLNELAGEMLVRDYKIAELSNEINQMQKGFELIGGLHHFSSTLHFDQLYDYFTEEINIKMQMDLSMVLLPSANDPTNYIPSFIKGNINRTGLDGIAVRISKKIFEYQQSLLVNSDTAANSFINSLISVFGVRFFILTPLVAQGRTIAYLFAGRKVENKLLAASQLVMYDVHALEAIAGVISTIHQQQQQFSLLENERNRISREMHDDIGAEVTKIKIFSQSLLLKNVGESDEKNKLKMIAESAGNMLQTINEIIWTMNSRNDDLANLMAYVRRYAAAFLESNYIDYEISFPDDIPSLFISNNNRRNIYLVVKEALNNIIKHANAKKVSCFARWNDNALFFSICDDGRGLCEKNQTGNGLLNMKGRVKEMGGEINIHSCPAGTTISFTIPRHGSK